MSFDSLFFCQHHQSITDIIIIKNKVVFIKCLLCAGHCCKQFICIFLISNILYWAVLIYNVLVSGLQQSDSVIQIHMSILFQILFPVRLLQNIKQSSLCYTLSPCWLFIFNRVVYIC